MKKIVFSGLVYGQKPTGIHRYANEILLEIDKKIESGEYELIVPEYAKNIPDFKNIKVVRYGKVKGLLWEQTSLLMYLYKNHAISINFTNSVPLLKPGVIVIHDVGYKVNPSFYKSLHGKLAMWWHRFNYWWASVCRIPVITVTEYSKKSIEKYYHINGDKITVIPNAWQHIERVVEEPQTLNRYGLQQKEFYFTLGSVSKRKNIEWIFNAAAKFPEDEFVVAGAAAKNSAANDNVIPSNVKMPGYISDAEMKSLMRNCKAFIFPSLFEGFGIPPLEAMSVGSPVIASNASCLPEIYGDAVTYIDPLVIPEKLDYFMDSQKTNRVLRKYSWSKSADLMFRFAKRIGEEHK